MPIFFLRSVVCLLWLLTVAPMASCFGSEHDQVKQFISDYCMDCHVGEEASANFDLETVDVASLFSNKARNPLPAELAKWEKAVKRLRARQMPPSDAVRPSEQEYVEVLQSVEGALDTLAAERPRPGRTLSIRRLSRTEYHNAIRDLLDVDVDVAKLLPADQESHGFDNVTVGDLSPTLMSRYITAAQQISRTSIGARDRGVGGVNFRLRPDRTQQSHVEGLPLGTRGGGLFRHTFAKAGVYEFQIRLTRDRDENIEGLHGTHAIDVLLDRKLVKRFTVVAPKQGKEGYERDDTLIDANLIARTYVSAGNHTIGATFPRQSSSLSETKRQPFDASFNRHRHPRPEPAIFEVAVTGPFDVRGMKSTESWSKDNSAPRRNGVIHQRPNDPTNRDQSIASAQAILQPIVRLAYRRQASEDNLAPLLRFFERDWQKHGFDAGIESALAAILVNPNFLLRVEAAPPETKSGDAYRVSDLELASRLSFFLWSSLPDDELLAAAESGRLSNSNELARQVLRMLRDERADSLATNFADQWLYLRNLESFSPNLRMFPDFDDNLRQSLRRETQLLFEFVLREDRSVLDMLKSDFSFLNERLASHYGIDGVSGSHFRKVMLDKDSRRGGLLRHGSVLAVSSYATRTSPTIRGNWVLENLMGTPAPPPPPNVPALKEKTSLVNMSIRDRLAEHRANPTCASCHDLMDPIGFALENYDAVGRWREYDGEEKIDSSGVLPDGKQLNSVSDLEAALIARPEMFVGTLVEKLLTYALGRGIDPSDGPAIRKVVRQSAEDDYSFSAIVLGVVESVPFQMRTAE